MLLEGSYIRICFANKEDTTIITLRTLHFRLCKISISSFSSSRSGFVWLSYFVHEVSER